MPPSPATPSPLTPNNNLADGVVYVALSDGWYYGTNPTKTQGSASNISFTVDTTAPTFSEVIGGDTTTVTVTMSEDVYATTSPTADDFSISGGGDPNVTGVAGIPYHKSNGRQLIHPHDLSSTDRWCHTLLYQKQRASGERCRGQ